jgi:hypothetical protein
MSLNMFRASPRPSSGAYNCINSLWFHRWSVGGSSVVGGDLTTTNHQRSNGETRGSVVGGGLTTTTHQRSNGETGGCECSCKFVMMDMETTVASSWSIYLN